MAQYATLTSCRSPWAVALAPWAAEVALVRTATFGPGDDDDEDDDAGPGSGGGNIDPDDDEGYDGDEDDDEDDEEPLQVGSVARA